jgi:hypothetical protein
VGANLVLIGLSLGAFFLIARRKTEPAEPLEVPPPA